jgi:deoxyribodipyrimidine photo-lyase
MGALRPVVVFDIVRSDLFASHAPDDRMVTSETAPVIVWFRNDLRLSDQPALHAAAERGTPLVCLYIYAPEEAGPWPPGAASRWWLHHGLTSLRQALSARGQPLLIRRGPSRETLTEIIRETGARAVFVNRHYEPALVHRDAAIERHLVGHGVEWHAFHGNLWFDPAGIATAQQTPYRVFTPYYRALRKLGLPDHVLPAPKWLPSFPHALASTAIDQLDLLPRIPWDAQFKSFWQPGEAAAQSRLEKFLDAALIHYPERRDIPDRDGTSRLSPHLHFGEISPRQIARAVNAHAAQHREPGIAAAAEHLLRELAWREFAHSVLHHFPHTTDAPLDARFERFPWQTDGGETLRRWQQGRTGIPIVDAGLRELWTTGFMHNRVRMIVASYLTKHLGLHWTLGARWFWDTLVDADLANNTFNWQWSAGCGADAAPYVRVFNPVTQGEKFDPHGSYVRRWVPELRGMSTDFIHQPWNATISARREAGLEGRYPAPLIKPDEGRKRALDAYAVWKDFNRK